MFEREVIMVGPGGHHGPGHGPGHHAHPGGPGERDVHIVRHGGPGGEGLDANKDGKLSFEEFAGPMRDHFKEADKNNNGFLDKDEMEGDGRRIMIRREKRE